VQQVEQLGAFLERASTLPAILEIGRRSMDMLALSAGERVVDVGCGTGVFLPRLAEAVGVGGQVVGVDLAHPFVDQARARTQDIRTVRVDQGDACALPYPDDSFDAAHCERVLQHLVDPGAALSEIARVVRPGGRVLVAEPDWGSMVVEHPDRESVRLLVDCAVRLRSQPFIGRELSGRLARTGLIERRFDIVPMLIFDFADLVATYLNLPEAVERLDDDGRLLRVRSQGILDDLEATSREGSFFAFGNVVLASGSVPCS
jgi:ubiquinone/menaquinone biosynthesis C-methylase UbiE